MSRRKIEFFVGGIYHIYSRGIEKRSIFLTDSDYYRFLESLYFFNDSEKGIKIARVKKCPGPASAKRKKLVGILCYCLMPNHFHLILTPLNRNDGIPKFMQKLMTGYAMYFNEKYERTGPLFEGRYKATWVNTNAYFSHLTRYIHLNPLNLIQPDWKEEGVKNWKESLAFLKNYKWSSYNSYIENKNYFSILEFSLLRQYLEVEMGESYISFVKEWIPERNAEVRP